MAVGSGDRQVALGLARGDVVLRVEGCEVVTEDLLGRVPLEGRGAGVPGRDPALRIERVDGVVLDDAHHQRQQFLMLPNMARATCALGFGLAGHEGSPVQTTTAETTLVVTVQTLTGW